MKCFFYILIVVVSIVFYNAVFNAFDKNNVKVVISSSSDLFDMSWKDRTLLEFESRNGNSEASFRLFLYYASVCLDPSCSSIEDMDRWMFYLSRAAIQGNVKAQYNYGVLLSSNDPAFLKYHNLDEAVYWFELAAKNGNAEAKTELQKINR